MHTHLHVTHKGTLRLLLLLLVITSMFLCCPHSLTSAAQPKVRPAGVAGGFYPADPQDLTKMVDGFLAAARPAALDAPLVALVSPHAGYPFSGPVAAYCYALLRGRKFSRVVVIAPSHYESFPFASIYDGDAYSTPLGQVPVDKAFAAKLAALTPLVQISEQGHGEIKGQWEHAVEDELPYLQRVLGDFKLVPVLMGDQSYKTSRALGVALASLIAQEGENPGGGFNTLILASSDLSHYHPYDDAVTEDHKTLDAIEEWDYFNLSINSERRVWEACGGAGIVAAMIAAERLGANRATVLKYANSGDTTGDKSRVVGYGAVAITKEALARNTKPSEFKLSGKERGALLNIARKSVETAVRQGKLYDCSPGGLAALEIDRGAFVTLKEKGNLRGCIGYIAPMKPLCMTVRDTAALAAVRDDRFPPVTAPEVPLLGYEISVLSPLRRVTGWKQIQVGRDGLLVWKAGSQGVLLPQVAREEHWDRTKFLNQTCLKAGLPESCWQDEGTDVFRFTAVIFGDSVGSSPVPDQSADRRFHDTDQQQEPGPSH
jgi:AmmeMemoRadiSam system protein B/AmmeMemoRadiSam system protein A